MHVLLNDLFDALLDRHSIKTATLVNHPAVAWPPAQALDICAAASDTAR
jgi:hypothetical protein